MLEPLKEAIDRFLATSSQSPSTTIHDVIRLNAELIQARIDLALYQDGLLEACDLIKQLLKHLPPMEDEMVSSSKRNEVVMEEGSHRQVRPACSECKELQERCNMLEERVTEQASLLMEKDIEIKRLQQDLTSLYHKEEHTFASPTVESTSMVIEPKPLRRIGASVRSSYLIECDSVS
ncbi:hypothetical protein GMRT_13326 [Giardia muris]|uniref:Uncharacterized protein n=1 Tax=Giardia muris TaxID=5742 RepID=A0A4Z1T186_GIAMU|nr:hypothetical protein GMRT_13326 [Giardia muris]|eukprot:TNJ26289.1 hypothetical protein GMRT_13326 [Giardia muris]